MKNLEPIIKNLREKIAENTSIIKSALSSGITIRPIEKETLLQQIERHEYVDNMACELLERLDKSKSIKKELSDMEKAHSTNNQIINELMEELTKSITNLLTIKSPLLGEQTERFLNQNDTLQS